MIGNGPNRSVQENYILNTKLYVDNLVATTTGRGLMNLFSAHGNGAEINLPLDHENGRPRCFGFVTTATPESARAAIQAPHGKQVATLTLTVGEARPHERCTSSSRGGRSPRRTSSHLYRAAMCRKWAETSTSASCALLHS